MEKTEITIFGTVCQLTMSESDDSKFTIILSCSSKNSRKLFPTLMCQINDSEELITAYYVVKPEKKEIGNGCIPFDTNIRFKRSEYRLASTIAKWMAVTYLTIEHDKWYSKYIESVSESNGYTIRKDNISLNIISENISTQHSVEFKYVPEEDGHHYIAVDSEVGEIHTYSMFDWEYKNLCIGIS